MMTTFWMLAVVLASASAASPWDNIEAYLTPDNIERLENGKFIVRNEGAKDAEGNSLGKGLVIAIIDAPKEEVWRHLTDTKKHTEFMPHLVEVELYETADGRKGSKETVRVVLRKVTYHVIHTFDEENGIMYWELDKTKKNDVNDTSGCWMVRPYGEKRTLIVYSPTVDSGFKVPGFLEDIAFNFNLPSVVKALKRRAESERVKEDE